MENNIGSKKEYSDKPADVGFKQMMRKIAWSFSLILAVAFGASALSQVGNATASARLANQPASAEQIFALANQARAEAGVGVLQWDQALAAAALKHCQRMAVEGPIAHRYGGELDLSERAAQAGARFSVIEENVALGPVASTIHEQWMHSPGHRTNLLSPEVDRVGVAVVAARGELYAVADYSRGVEKLSAAQVEARVAQLMSRGGVEILRDPSQARAACAMDGGMPRAQSAATPRFVIRWQGAELTQLPQALADKLASGRYRQAAVGNCPAQSDAGSFTAYRLAVLLY
jgi:uncharacterized protein YkwD